MEIWSYGDMDLWRYGAMELWNYGAMELWRRDMTAQHRYIAVECSSPRPQLERVPLHTTQQVSLPSGPEYCQVRAHRGHAAREVASKSPQSVSPQRSARRRPETARMSVPKGHSPRLSGSLHCLEEYTARPGQDCSKCCQSPSPAPCPGRVAVNSLHHHEANHNLCLLSIYNDLFHSGQH